MESNLQNVLKMVSDLDPLIIAAAFLLFSVIFVVLWWKTKQNLNELTRRFQPILDIESEVKIIIERKQQIEQEIQSLRGDYAAKKKIYSRLVDEVAVFDETIAMAQLGVYRPHFEFSDSEEFKQQIRIVKDEQKEIISSKTAIVAGTDWAVSGSKSEGRKMTNRAIRLMLRAFNNECDSAISNTRWNNVQSMEKRIERAFDQINALSETMDMWLSTEFFDLKLKELRLTHEYREKQKQERDHKSEMARLKREEERLVKDAAAAEIEEQRYQKLLDKAQSEATGAVGPKVAEFEAKIAELTRDLEEAHQKAERAKSMAEQTRAGHIYVISNIGSFGDGVFKIGMTRRLDPTDRVRELGDASVPFLFDTHAMVYSEDAPSLEKTLHTAFDARRVNKANDRKEFFRVSLEEIRNEVRNFSPEAEFVEAIEAQEYHETLALIRSQDNSQQEAADEFPDSI